MITTQKAKTEIRFAKDTLAEAYESLRDGNRDDAITLLLDLANDMNKLAYDMMEEAN